MSTPVRKQRMTHDDFVTVREWAEAHISRQDADRLVDQAISDVRRTVGAGQAAYAWSGGKDSAVLSFVCEAAGVTACMHGITHLEYPAMTQWIAAHKPARLELVNNGWDLDWLAAHPEMLFPKNSTIAARWLVGLQRATQHRFARRQRLAVILRGNRIGDGNNCTPRRWPTAGDVLTYCPLAHWSHAAIFATIHHYDLPQPPIYRWPRGYRAGTHPWAMRRCPTAAEGWQEIWTIDPGIVRDAAARLPSARAFLESGV